MPGTAEPPFRADAALMVGLLIAVATVLGAGGSARGQVDDFNNGNDQSWTHSDPAGSLPGASAATYSFPNGGYEISVPPSPDPMAYGPARGEASGRTCRTRIFPPPST